jgi:tetratricopeptide (TPR) repeat protein
MSPKTYGRAITILAAAVFMLPPAFSQAKGGATTTTTGGGATTGTGTGATSTSGAATPSITTNPQQTVPNTSQGMPVPIAISGRVMIDDGTPPPDTAVIERVCSGSVRAEGYTDRKGYFSVELGMEQEVLQDASNSGGVLNGGEAYIPGQGRMSSGLGGGVMSNQRYRNCDLRANLPGYRSQLVSLANRDAMDNPNIGTIFLHPLGHAEGRLVSAISLAAPKDARKAFEKGLDQARRQKPDDAMKSYRKAVDVYPQYAAAWFELGKLQAAKGQADAAHQSFDASVEADPKYLNPYLELSRLALGARNWQELADVTGRAVKLDPFDYPQQFFFNSVANYNLRNMDAAEKSAREAEKLDTGHHYPQVSHLLGVILAQRQDYAGAAGEMRNYLKLAPDAADAATVRAQLDQMEKLSAQSAPPNR